MGDQNSFEQFLQAARQAVEQGDWNAWRVAIEPLLLQLPTSHAVRLTRDFIARRLPVFERHQPGMPWVREVLEALTQPEDAASSGREWPFWEDSTGPGGASFANAVESLWMANQRRGDTRQCTTELVDALSDAIMADATEPWGARHPEEWALWYQLAMAGEGAPRKHEIQIAMARDLGVKSRKRAGLLEVADLLEAALRGGASSSGGSERR
ncbi:hypothetical protein [Hyalangium versicolor]|uniref:hypothetical protein n=1 Tax=Hyalangium versicolor TaxID=2861190 RepID=UPI001CCA0867|nr:hypothetical protein [Hyalangium versicolor]